MRYLITFSYDGSAYNGYQKQVNKNTIQDNLEDALLKINNTKVSIVASGRTDANVHAINQKAHFDLSINIEPNNLKKALNSLINKDIYVKNVEIVNSDFHARFNVTSKEYIYKINTGEYNPIEKNYIYQYNKPLNVDLMKKSLDNLLGTHNFKAFTKKTVEEKNYIKTIISYNITEYNGIITISLIGSGFLRYMVRNIVGTLINISENKIKQEDILNIINSCDRCRAGITASPVGLYLNNVNY